MSAARDLQGWLPVRVEWTETRPSFDWIYFGDTPLLDPFFGQTADARMRVPFNLVFRQRTTVDALLSWQAESPGLRPAGFIFHVSRCGSTLATRLLALSPEHVVASEPGTPDDLLRLRRGDPSTSEDDRIAWLRALVSAIGQPRRGGETRFYIKWDAWTAVDLPLIRRAFPDTPWIFLFRDPVEVMVSQLERRGGQLVPGVLDPRMFGLELAAAAEMPAEVYGAHGLAAIARAALEGLRTPGPPGRLVAYREMPDVCWNGIARFFGIPVGDALVERMRREAAFDAKNPALSFERDVERKQAAATDALRAAVGTVAGPVFAELEAARLRSSHPSASEHR